ncbi:MAG: 5-dehydro-2-deoxygluconokinase [Propioniciclava sp.]
MSRDPAVDLEVLTMGRTGVDIYPLQSGVGLQDVETFGKFLGGSPTNVAVAAARLGHGAGVVTAVGDDPFGRFVTREMVRLGVSDRFVGVDPDLHTPVTFCEIFPPDNFPLWFYRSPTAPDMRIEVTDLDVGVIESVPLFWVTTTGLSEEPSAGTHLAALQARGRRAHTILDLDYRPMFWPTPQTAMARIQEVLPWVSVAVGNREECQVAVGEDDPDRAADALLAAGVELAVVKCGGEGVLAKTSTERVEVAATVVEVVNGLGAGDAFGGSLCHGLLSGWSVARTVAFASAAGAIVASRLECSTAMPAADEVEAALAGSLPEPRRSLQP